ncbi:MAG: LptA/OstA family protein [Nitrospirota bacterium]
MFSLKDNLLVFYGILILLIFSKADIISAEEIAGEEKQPLSITADMMTVKNMENKAIFQGNVTVIKGDVRLNADRVEVSFSLPEKGRSSKESGFAGFESMMGLDNQNEIDLIEAIGEVKMAQGNRKAKAEKAFYYQVEEKIVLTGNPEAWDNDQRIAGKKITIYLKEDKSIVEESRVVINPK